MKIEYNEEDFNVCLDYAWIQRWLSDDMHKRLYRVMVAEAHRKDPENKSKAMMLTIAKNLNPESFVAALQKTREMPSGKEFSENIIKSIKLLCFMENHMTKSELSEFIETKESELGVIDERPSLEKIKNFLGKKNNFEYLRKITKRNLNVIDNPISAAAMSLIESIPSLSEAELYRHLKEGYEKSGDVWEMIVDILEGLIQIRGSEDVTD